MTQLYDCRDAFAAALEDIATHDIRVCAVVNDSVGSSKISNFGKRFPDRLINVGIAEQTMKMNVRRMLRKLKVESLTDASARVMMRALHYP